MSNGSDINVSSIEEAIEILTNAIRCNEKQFEELGTHILLQDEEQEAIKIVLANLEALCDMQKSADKDLQRQKQINEEHQKINGKLREKVKELEEDLYSANCIISDRLDDIPRNKLEEIIFSNIHKGQGIFKNQYMYSTNDCVYIVRKIVEELLQ